MRLRAGVFHADRHKQEVHDVTSHHSASFLALVALFGVNFYQWPATHHGKRGIISALECTAENPIRLTHVQTSPTLFVSAMRAEWSYLANRWIQTPQPGSLVKRWEKAHRKIRRAPRVDPRREHERD